MADRPLRIGMVAGEASGDAQGAALMRAVADILPAHSIEVWGIGSRQMADAGARILRDCAPYSSIGVAAALAGMPTMVAAMGEMKKSLAADPPDVLVSIDAGAFNVPLARWVKKRSLCPVFYYFPPGSWRRTKRQGRNDLAEVADVVVTPFPWSAEGLKEAGVNAAFVGHPLLDLVKPSLAPDEFYDRFGLDSKNPLIALLPGSRPMEIKTILPAMIGAAGEITKRLPNAQFAVALAPTVSRDMVEEIIRTEQQSGQSAALLQLMQEAGGRLAHIAQSRLAPTPRLATNEGLTVPMPSKDEPAAHRAKPPAHAPLVICEGLTYDVLARCDMAITKSGTSTLEAAILKKPMVVVYRGNSLMEIEWAIRKKSLNIAYISMPNILAEEAIVPELIQEQATPEKIAATALEILLDPSRTAAVKSRLAEVVRESLGEPGGVRRAAEMLIDLVQRKAHTVNDPFSGEKDALNGSRR